MQRPTKVERFGKSKEKWLKKDIKQENGIPDACTFRNVVKAIDTHSKRFFCRVRVGIGTAGLRRKKQRDHSHPQAIETVGIEVLHCDNRGNGNAERDCSGHHE